MTRAEVEEKCDVIASVEVDWPVRVSFARAIKDNDAEQRAEIERLQEVLRGIIEIGKRDLTNPKYDGYFEAAREVLKETP